MVVGDLVDSIVGVVSALRTEIALFLMAILIHALFFGKFLIRKPSKTAKVVPHLHPVRAKSNDLDNPMVERDRSPVRAPKIPMSEQIQTAYQHSDHRCVLSLWNVAKGLNSPLEPSHLAMVSESMQRLKIQSESIVANFQVYLKRNSAIMGNVQYINELLEPLAKSLDTVIVDGLLQCLQELGLSRDSKTYETLVQMHYGTRSYAQIEELIRSMTSENIQATSRTSLVLLKVSLRAANFNDAMHHYARLSSGAGSPPPSHLDVQLVELAVREDGIGLILEHLEAGKMRCTTEIVNTLLSEAGRCQVDVSDRLVLLASGLVDIKDGKTYEQLLRLAGNDRQKVLVILDELLSLKRPEYIRDSAALLLAALRPATDVHLAERLYTQVCDDPHTRLPTFSGLLCFFAEAGEANKACDVYRNHLRKKEGEEIRRPLIDTQAQKCIIKSALTCNQTELIVELFESSSAARTRCVSIIRGCAQVLDLEQLFSFLGEIDDKYSELAEAIWTAALEACIEAGRIDEFVNKIRKSGVKSQRSHEAIMRAYVKNGNHSAAWEVLEDMRQSGFQPNIMLYNDYLNGAGCGMSPWRSKDIWDKVEAMSHHGLIPNRVTCSILLKNLKHTSAQSEIQKMVELLDNMQEGVDEVLISSLAEAYARIGKPKLLADKLHQLQVAQSTAEIKGAHTFGSLIKACGQANDMDGAWKYWNEMLSKQVLPTNVTIGCMVEAVAGNGAVDEAYKLVQQLMEDPRSKDGVNSVVFGSLLKGYGKCRRMDRVWAIFEEMQNRRVETSTVTYNALIDACARNDCMDPVPALLNDMRRPGCKPNVITYSTAIKGYIRKGDMQQAMDLLHKMRQSSSSHLKPDVIMYNTLLEGCITANLPNEGQLLFAQMEGESVAPNNYTLTLLARIFSRLGQLDTAFQTVEGLIKSRKYRLKADSYVSGALMEACVENNDPLRGATVMEQMFRNRCSPQTKHVEQLLGSLVQAKHVSKVSALLRQLMTPFDGRSPEKMDDAFLADLFARMSGLSPDMAKAAVRLHADLRANGAIVGPLFEQWRCSPSVRSKVAQAPWSQKWKERSH